jgi:hypothetical protein
MGACCSAPPGAAEDVRNNVNKDKDKRVSNWAATGVVSLREARLAALPAHALAPEILGTAKVLDASNNALVELPDSIAKFAVLQR